MNRRAYLLGMFTALGLCLVLGMVSVAWSAMAQDAAAEQETAEEARKAPSRTLWSHRCGELPYHSIERHLEELGGYGWELVSANRLMMGGSVHDTVFFCLKRPREP